MKENFPRILIGLLVMFVFGRVAMRLSPDFQPTGDDLQSAINSFVLRASVFAYSISFIATVIGGFIAREKFVIPAAIYASLGWTYGVYLGNPTQISYLFSPALVAALLIGIAVAVAGSLAGMKLFAMTSARRTEVQ